MKKILPLLLLLCIGMIEMLPAQNVFSPQDVNNPYPNPAPPAPPANTMAKWYRSVRQNWNTNNFKSYYFNGMAFRLRYPKNYNPSNPTKYPLIVFFHGGGEIGPVSDNDYQLQWGAQPFEEKINQDQFNAFLLFPQTSQASGWDGSYYERVNRVMDSLQKYCNMDPDRVISMGLSNGGFAALAHSIYFPTRDATSIGSSPALVQNFTDQDKNNLVHIPVWVSSGGHDVNPSPQEVDGFVNSFRAKGGDIRYSFFPDLGHLTWSEQWAEPYLVPYWNNAHKANPLIFFQKSSFPNEASVNAKLGITAGFAQYQWQRNGVDIPGATSNEYTATSSGTYRVHFKRSLSGNWSDWSPRPAVITVDAPAGSGLKYSYYEGEWYALPNFSALTPVKTGTTPNFDISVRNRNDLFAVLWEGKITITTPGRYTFETNSDDGSKLYVNQPYSQGATALVNNDNPHGPTLVSASIDLPAGNIQIAGSYFENTGGELMQVFYSGPGVNRQQIPNNVLSLPSASGDLTPPSTPQNLKVLSATNTSLSLDWDNSMDNVGVSSYDVFVNGAFNMSSTSSDAVINNLNPGTTYAIKVKAVDQAANSSPFSTEIPGTTTSTPSNNGVRYSYYEGEYYAVPNFSTLTPVKSGTSSNFDLAVRNRNDLFAIRWDANITITTPGTYTFETISDDGSKLYVNQPYSHTGPALVNNDFPHGPTSVSASITLAAGTYPITATFFENTGNELMQVWYSGPNVQRQQIPTSVLTLPSGDGTPPSTPTGLKLLSAANTSLSIDWDDATDNVGVTGYDVYVNGAKNMSSSVSNAVINNLSPATTYAIKVLAFDQAANVSAFSGEISATTTNTASNNGVRYSYYEGEYYAVPNFSTLTPVKTGTSANFDLGVRNRNDLFAMRWDANITITTPGTYTFETISDDGSKLYVNQPYSHTGPALVNNDFPHAATSVSASITLAAGTYPITATFFENTGGEQMQVWYSGPNIQRQQIPTSVLTLPSGNVVANGLNYRFYQGTWDALPNFNNLTPVKTGNSSNIDLGVRTAGVNDNYAFVWEGYFNAQVAGNYTFEVISDDGSMMFLGSQYSPSATPFINNDYLHAANAVSKTINLAAGLYPVCFTFFEKSGGEQMQVNLTGPGIPKQPIPNAAFVGSGTPATLTQVQTLAASNRNSTIASATISDNTGTRNPGEETRSSFLTNAFPNPFRENLNIQYYNTAVGNKVSVDVSDVSGKVLFNRKFSNLPAGTSTISLNSLTGQLSPGIYTLRLQVNGVPFKIWKVVKAKN